MHHSRPGIFDLLCGQEIFENPGSQSTEADTDRLASLLLKKKKKKKKIAAWPHSMTELQH